MSHPTDNSQDGMRTTVELATKMANTMLVCLRETYHYLVPKAKAEGIEIDAQSAHALAVSLWIQLARERAWLRMPATRFTKPEPKEERPQKKAELFPRVEQPIEPDVPFSNPGVAPALRRLRQMLRRDSVDEQELLAILRESTPQDAVAPATLDEAPARSLELLLSRWSVVRELIEAGRRDNGESA
jgi:hypothetical protein